MPNLRGRSASRLAEACQKLTDVPSADVVLEILMSSAEGVIANGLNQVRLNDPHRYGTLLKEYGNCPRRLIIDYLPGGEVQLSLSLLGDESNKRTSHQLFIMKSKPGFPNAKEE